MSEITLLDGSIGQELVKRAGKAPTPLWSTTVMIDQPDILRDVHAEYFNVGASVATTNTYPVLHDRLVRAGLQDQIETLWAQAVKSAQSARNAHGSGRIAGSIGPLIASYRPDICPSAAEAEELYRDVVDALAPHVDLLLIETMCSVDQVDGALRAAMKSGRPVWLAVSVEDFDGSKLRSGENLADLAPVLNRHDTDAILINCSRPEAVSTAVDIAAQFGRPFGAYANGFTKIAQGFLKDAPTVDALQERSDLSPAAYADFAMGWIDQGATIVGGCCEVGPDHIAELAARIKAAGHHIV
ncbi:MAG: homocysteine S-methyltransferase family protein [Marinovum sp.]|jgi:S-methylmethionine-dependent homocysteine/selenocysteine methylase|nr:homocysteine S-methyltransferase family protein [Marinovum sp.]